MRPEQGKKTPRPPVQVRPQVPDWLANRWSSWGSPWQLFHVNRLGNPDCKYITRWILDLGPLGSLRLHHWYGDDDGRALHDHPWGFLTVCLAGSYMDVTEHEFCGVTESGDACHYVLPGDTGLLCSQRRDDHPVYSVDVLVRGSVRWRPAEYTHTVRTTGAWTVLWTQPKRRYFGFYVWRKGQRTWIKANKFFARYGFPACSD